jgi:hypothetical protein
MEILPGKVRASEVAGALPLAGGIPVEGHFVVILGALLHGALPDVGQVDLSSAAALGRQNARVPGAACEKTYSYWCGGMGCGLGGGGGVRRLGSWPDSSIYAGTAVVLDRDAKGRVMT